VPKDSGKKPDKPDDVKDDLVKTDHHLADVVLPLIRRQKPKPEDVARHPSGSPDSAELYKIHKLSEAAVVEDPLKLVEHLGRIHSELTEPDESEEDSED
jgi:hypothetical protein